MQNNYSTDCITEIAEVLSPLCLHRPKIDGVCNNILNEPIRLRHHTLANILAQSQPRPENGQRLSSVDVSWIPTLQYDILIWGDILCQDINIIDKIGKDC